MIKESAAHSWNWSPSSPCDCIEQENASGNTKSVLRHRAARARAKIPRLFRIQNIRIQFVYELIHLYAVPRAIVTIFTFCFQCLPPYHIFTQKTTERKSIALSKIPANILVTFKIYPQAYRRVEMISIYREIYGYLCIFNNVIRLRSIFFFSMKKGRNLRFDYMYCVVTSK